MRVRDRRIGTASGSERGSVKRPLQQATLAYTWAEECSEEEREVLLAIATNETINPAERRDSLRRLRQKEILERRGDQYRFTIELFRLWILKDQLAFESAETNHGEHGEHGEKQ